MVWGLFFVPSPTVRPQKKEPPTLLRGGSPWRTSLPWETCLLVCGVPADRLPPMAFAPVPVRAVVARGVVDPARSVVNRRRLHVNLRPAITVIDRLRRHIDGLRLHIDRRVIHRRYVRHTEGHARCDVGTCLLYTSD